MTHSEEQDTHFGFSRVSPSEKTEKVREVFDSVATRYDIMNDLMSFGLHRLWKRHTVSIAKLRPGSKVLDLAGGTGDVSKLLSKSMKGTGTVVLSDINQSMLMLGRDRFIDENMADNIICVQANAQYLPFPDYEFDLVTIAFGLRNVTDKDQALREIYRVLKPGAKVLILEFSELQLASLEKAYDKFSFEILPKIGEVVAKDSDSYRYLAESIRTHPNQQTLLQMMTDAGFERCKYHNVLGGIVAIHEGLRL